MSQRFKDYEQKEENGGGSGLDFEIPDVRFKDYEQKEENGGGSGLDFEIPDVTSISGQLDRQIQLREDAFKEHQDQMEKEEEDVKKGKRKPRQKPKGGTICFCGNPHCRIGEFVETQG